MKNTNTQVNGRQAIVTKYFGPSNVKGSRVKASCEAGSITLSWDHALNAGDNHASAAQALLVKLDWARGPGCGIEWLGSALPDGKGYAFVALEGNGSRNSLNSEKRGA